MWFIIFFIVAIWGGIWLIGKIGELVSARRERIRDQAAKEIFGGLNIESVIDSYKNKLKHIKYVRTDSAHDTLEWFNEWHGGRDAVLLGQCPDCEGGNLIKRNGKYGEFLACTKYPKCNYTKNIKKAREEYKKSINEQIISDIQRAYS